MTPIYFPFTYVSKQAAGLLSVCFDKTIVYQPSSQNIPESMTRLADKGMLDIQIPAQKDEEKLAGIIREYKDWAKLHQGSKMSFFKTQTETTPFYDEISVHQIRSDIKKKEKNEISEQQLNPLLQARIFLSMAQEFDENHWDVSTNLESFAKMEKALIEEIRGGNELDDINTLTPNQAITKDEPGTHMTEQRLKSWIRLLICDSEKSNFYVTTSRYVIETLFENFQNMEVVFRDTIPENLNSNKWKNHLKENLENISKNSDIGNDLKQFPALTVYRIPYKADEFFSQYLNRESSKKLENKKEYTLIGLIEML